MLDLYLWCVATTSQKAGQRVELAGMWLLGLSHMLENVW